MKKLCYFLINIFLLIFLNGCVPILIGSGVLAGYTLSNDSAIGEVKSEYREIWDASLKVMNSYKTQENQFLLINESKGIIKAKIMGHNVSLRIDTISSKFHKLRVSARKLFLPKPQFAQKIFMQIIEKLE